MRIDANDATQRNEKLNLQLFEQLAKVHCRVPEPAGVTALPSSSES
jgi:hypothetical protein